MPQGYAYTLDKQYAKDGILASLMSLTIQLSIINHALKGVEGTEELQGLPQ